MGGLGRGACEAEGTANIELTCVRNRGGCLAPESEQKGAWEKNKSKKEQEISHAGPCRSCYQMTFTGKLLK